MINKTRYMLFVLVAVFYSGISFGQLTTGDCDCDAEANLTFSFVSDPDTCEVTFTADIGSDCLVVSQYNWYVNEDPVGISTGSNPDFIYESLSNLDRLAVKAQINSGGAVCLPTYTMNLTEFTCENAGGAVPFIEKNAYRMVGGDPVTGVYKGEIFEWHVEIFNGIPNFELWFLDFWPDGTGGPAGYPNPLCAFNILGDVIAETDTDGDGVYELSLGIIPDPFEWNLTLPVGITRVVYTTQACNDNAYAGQFFSNCFEAFDQDPSLTLGFSGSSDTPDPIALECSEVELLMGCPGYLTDGFCLSAEELMQGEIIESKYTGHNFIANVVYMEGDIYYDPEIFTVPTMTLDHPSVPWSFDIDVTEIEPGIIHFVIDTDTSASFNILGGGTPSPFAIQAELLSDLTDCTSFNAENLVFTNSSGDTVSFRIDPGIFCYEYDEYPGGGYDEASIVPDPVNLSCVGSEPVTLTAIGPFLSQDTGTTYLWSTGETTQSITVTSGGTYTVDVDDSEGCERFGSFTVEDCGPVECVCGELNPIILADVNSCLVDFSVLMPDCSNLSTIQYNWTFSNGNTYVGASPPTQNFAGPTYGGPTSSLTITYSLGPSGGSLCLETVENDVFVPCRGGGGGKKSTIYPNPAIDMVTVDTTGKDVAVSTIEILNIQGMILQQDHTNGAVKSQCDISSLKPGIYFVRLLDSDDQLIEIQRLIVK